MRYQFIILFNCLLVFYSCRHQGADNREIGFVSDIRAMELNNRASQLFQDGKTDSALILLNMAIQIDSNYLIAYSNKCTFLWQLKRNEEALRTAKRATQIKEVIGLAYLLEGQGYERVGHFDSARTCYLKVIDYDEQNPSTKLSLALKASIVELVTIAKGKDYGLKKLQQFFGKELDTLSRSDLKIVKQLKNDIESYQGGGMLEFLDSQFRQYCITTDESMDEVEDGFINKGINVQGIIGRKGGYYIQVNDKFRTKVLALGLVECDD